MPDQEQSTRPVARALRESFISYFQEEGQEAALRFLDGLAYNLAMEGRSDYLIPDGKRDYITEADVLAAAGDLRQAADQLRESVQGLVEAGHDEREALRITVAVADASSAVQPIADTLDAALAVYLAAIERGASDAD